MKYLQFTILNAKKLQILMSNNKLYETSVLAFHDPTENKEARCGGEVCARSGATQSGPTSSRSGLVAGFDETVSFSLLMATASLA